MATSKRSRRSVDSESTSKIAVAGANASSADDPAARRPALLRKSSSASLLDAGNGTPPDGANTSSNGEVFPKLRRKSSSLQDVNTAVGDEPRRHSEVKPKPKKSARQQQNRRASGWNTPTSSTNPSLPQIQSGSSPSKSLSRLSSSSQPNTGGRPLKSKKAGDIELVREATINVVVKYQLGQHELKKFKQCFKQIDLDASGMIDYDEFFEFIDETKTPFSEGLFRMIDADSNGTIDYEEFVHAMVLYCMYTRDEILQFAFDTFDPAKTGSIGEKEFKRLISVVNDGKPVFPGNFKNALTEFDRNKDGLLDFEEFKIMNKRYPMLLFPCFRLQDRMQKSTLGESHWLQLQKRLYQKLKLENYQRKNNGALPALSLVGTIRRFFHLDTMDVYHP
ncbi:hypothetical protein Gpo141_00000407 [Globisporangium polare]